ncbi:vitamin K epoxide reductase family protein [Vulgatibacter sp.]|uniref:vitamin K epoxide reductase family protein n=1 Tax=Vulgatibacter sp. TaxID=1971226 RepID=UPI003569BB7E
MAVGLRAHWEDAVDLDAHPPPFDRNPSAWNQRVPIAILAAAATVIAAYMALFQVGLIDSVWDPVFGDGSEKVLESPAAKALDAVLRVPDSAFGAFGYLSEVILSLVGSTRRWQFRPWMVLLFGLDVIPLGIVSAILVVVQGVVVGSWCFPCLVTAAISLGLVFLAYDEVWACLKYLARVWRRVDGDRKKFWEVFWGRASREAWDVSLGE